MERLADRHVEGWIGKEEFERRLATLRRNSINGSQVAFSSIYLVSNAARIAIHFSSFSLIGVPAFAAEEEGNDRNSIPSGRATFMLSISCAFFPLKNANRMLGYEASKEEKSFGLTLVILASELPFLSQYSRTSQSATPLDRRKAIRPS